MANRTVFYWGTVSFSGAGQFNEGPFVMGSVTTMLRAKVTGGINHQGVAFGATSVANNELLWGLSIVPHGSAAPNIITETDNNNVLIRKQTSLGNIATFWAPSTDTAAYIRSLDMNDRWAGQYIFLASMDMWLSFAPPFGGSTDNFNTYGTVEAWWA